MRLMGLEALVPKPGTSKASPQNKIYPYLLRGLTVDRPNQVWAADITYVPMAKGFLYLGCALKDRRTMRLIRGMQEHFGLGRLATMRQRFEAAIISNER
jgi:putative transposase